MVFKWIEYQLSVFTLWYWEKKYAPHQIRVVTCHEQQYPIRDMGAYKLIQVWSVRELLTYRFIWWYRKTKEKRLERNVVGGWYVAPSHHLLFGHSWGVSSQTYLVRIWFATYHSSGLEVAQKSSLGRANERQVTEWLFGVLLSVVRYWSTHDRKRRIAKKKSLIIKKFRFLATSTLCFSLSIYLYGDCNLIWDCTTAILVRSRSVKTGWVAVEPITFCILAPHSRPSFTLLYARAF